MFEIRGSPRVASITVEEDIGVRTRKTKGMECVEMSKFSSNEGKIETDSTRNCVVNVVVVAAVTARMVEIFEMVDVARGSRLGAWLRACCLFKLPSKSRGVFRSNSTLVLEFSFP
ncbi:hypothetical protein Tco_0535428 [Tanacetum coccineum]